MVWQIAIWNYTVRQCCDASLLVCTNLFKKCGLLQRRTGQRDDFDLVASVTRKHIWHYYQASLRTQFYINATVLSEKAQIIRSHDRWLLIDSWIPFLVLGTASIESFLPFPRAECSQPSARQLSLRCNCNQPSMSPLKLSHIRVIHVIRLDCSMCQQLVPHVF